MRRYYHSEYYLSIVEGRVVREKEEPLIQTPIRQVLFTIQKHQMRALLMGGQACVFYGAAQFSKDVDFEVEKEKDRVYWEPLKREMEEFRRAERENEETGG